MARITAGALKGRALIVPPSCRATSAKVRQAIFNIVGTAIEDARVLDAFAGSGALGLEALSRGAASVAFIESDAEAVVSIRENLARLVGALPSRAWRVLHLDVVRGFRELGRSGLTFDLILCDPPYGTEEGKKALNAIVECAILARTGLVAIEHDHRTALPSSCGPLVQWTRRRYGGTVLSLYRAP